MSTPTWGLPFPTQNAVPNVPGDLQALAEATDAALTEQDTSDGLSGQRVQTGYIVQTADASGQITVTFPSPFAGAPVVMCDLGDISGSAQKATPLHSTVTSSGFAAQVYRADGTAVSGGGFRLAWIAIGPA